MGKVEFGGIVKDVCLAYTPEAQVGDYVIVHVGFAISRMDEAEAQEIFTYLEEIGRAGKRGWLAASMKYIDEYRDAEGRQAAGRGHRPDHHAAVDHHGGLRRPDPCHRPLRHGRAAAARRSRLIHGPGCPVCVTPLEMIDKAIAIASRPEVIFCSFGDMLRVPGSDEGPAHRQGGRRRRADRLFADGRRDAGRAKSRSGRWCSSPSASRPPPPPTRWPWCRRPSWG